MRLDARVAVEAVKVEAASSTDGKSSTWRLIPKQCEWTDIEAVISGAAIEAVVSALIAFCRNKSSVVFVLLASTSKPRGPPWAAGATLLSSEILKPRRFSGPEFFLGSSRAPSSKFPHGTP